MDILNDLSLLKVIRTQADHEAAVQALAQLMAGQPEAGTKAADLIETLAILVRDYESTRHPIDPADPIDAILFRMEQGGLSPRDLVPYFGSRGRVSEVLSRKRPLTLQMIRNLHRGLDIPAASLLQQDVQGHSVSSFDWQSIPFAEMRRRGWIDRLPSSATEAAEVWKKWLRPLQPLWSTQALYHLQRHIRSTRAVDSDALYVWTARVAMKALEQDLAGPFDPAVLTDDFLREVCRISVFSTGPKLVQEFLGKFGIALVVEATMPKTYLDGAALRCRGDLAVVAMTLRYDRLDSFWFVLLHELAHLSRHLGQDVESFYDDLDAGALSDPREVEADQLASELLIPSDIWKTSPASKLKTPEAAAHLANKLKIHPAIVAGRIRFCSNNYRILNGCVGHGDVRRCFPEFNE